ncbi:MAG: polyphosphate polymerase domain-containing protein [Clostridia bacterium]|nr:polyphosphate polymerase domain-containing protein [Clostridia bacterium]
MAQTVFRRYELKYLLTSEEKARVLEAMAPYMTLDRYGRSTIRNLYYDTDSFLLIRRSIEKPLYKEKLRIRSYTRAGEGDEVFVELKKKYERVVYKRRLAMPFGEAKAWLAGESKLVTETQIAREIEYFRALYGTLHPTVFLSYEREAYYERNGGDFRVTFDDTVLCRREALSFSEGEWGSAILPEGRVLMELKCSGGIPLWMVEVLSREGIYKTSFSKYGTAYKNLIFPQMCAVNRFGMMEVK